MSNTITWPVYIWNKDWKRKTIPTIKWTWYEERTKNFLRYYWQDYSLWRKLANKHFIATEVAVCIAWADTHLWYATKTPNNIGNVWNTDSGKTRTPATKEQWIEAIFWTLNGKYLGQKQTIWDLSYAGSCKIRCDKVYATSNSNWETNVLNCMSNILQKKITPDFQFRAFIWDEIK